MIKDFNFFLAAASTANITGNTSAVGAARGTVAGRRSAAVVVTGRTDTIATERIPKAERRSVVAVGRGSEVEARIGGYSGSNMDGRGRFTSGTRSANVEVLQRARSGTAFSRRAKSLCIISRLVHVIF